jgi:hypothetical protein
MAQVVYAGVQTAQALSNVSNRLMLTSVELAVHAAATALKAMRSGNDQQQNIVENPLVKDELEAMDIEAKIRTVHALVLTIQKQRQSEYRQSRDTILETENALPVSPVDESDVVGVCLEQVKEVLDSITSTINSLNSELDAHEQRWFSSWRTPDTKHHLIALKAKTLVLDKRVDMLLKVRSFVTPLHVEGNITNKAGNGVTQPHLQHNGYAKQSSYDLS